MGLGEGNEKADGLARKGTSTQRTGSSTFLVKSSQKRGLEVKILPPEDFCRENAARSFIQVHPDVVDFFLGSFKTENWIF